MAARDDEVRDFYERYLQRCNDHDFGGLSDFVAHDVNGPSEMLAGYVAGLRDVVSAYPDYRWQLQQLLVDGDWLAAHLIGSGTHRGAFRGVAATGRSISTQELVVYRVAAGKIVACWGDLGSTVRDELVSGG